MSYPRIEIISHSHMATQILYVASAESKGINLSSIVQAVEWNHTAGEAPTAKLIIPFAILEAATEEQQIIIQKIERAGEE
ncbi:MAG TPA: hypothetical protein VIY48_16880 [Candidatus Paceibacterota bacterium]